MSKTGAPPSAGTRSLFSKKSVSLFREMTFRKSPRGEAFEIALFAGFPQCRDGLSRRFEKGFSKAATYRVSNWEAGQAMFCTRTV